MIKPNTYLAASEASSSDGLFGALGIDWKILIIQIIAFMIMVLILGKFVYPKMIKSVDDRMEKIIQTSESFEKAQTALEIAQSDADKILIKARKDASVFLADAKNEARHLLEDAEVKAREKSNLIIVNGKKELAQEVDNLRKQLKKESVLIIADATSKLTKQLIDPKKDEQLIKNAISEVKNVKNF